jgi:small subunit ribosomal protein S17
MKNISTRGRKFTGLVVSDRMSKTVTVEWKRKKYIPKYERYEKQRTKIKAHNPDDIGAVKGDVVEVKETRPLSKTKHFVVVKVLGKQGPVDVEDYDATKKEEEMKKETKDEGN